MGLESLPFASDKARGSCEDTTNHEEMKPRYQDPDTYAGIIYFLGHLAKAGALSDDPVVWPSMRRVNIKIDSVGDLALPEPCNPPCLRCSRYSKQANTRGKHERASDVQCFGPSAPWYLTSARTA